MKKLFLFLLLIVGMASFGQNYYTGQPVVNKRVGPGTYTTWINLQNTQASQARLDWHWEIWVEYTSHKNISAHSYMVPQESGTNGSGSVNWMNYPGATVDSIKHPSGVSEFREVYSAPCRQLRLFTFIGTADSVTYSVWYTLIK